MNGEMIGLTATIGVKNGDSKQSVLDALDAIKEKVKNGTVPMSDNDMENGLFWILDDGTLT